MEACGGLACIALPLSPARCCLPSSLLTGVQFPASFSSPAPASLLPLTSALLQAEQRKQIHSGSRRAGVEASYGWTEKRDKDLRSLVAGALLGLAISLSPPAALADFLSYDHADLRGADLSRQDLHGAVFAACDCRKINLQASNLDSTTDTFAGFQGANLQNTSWVRALADRVVFRGSNLQNANFTNAILSGSQFDDADITGADFTEAILDNYQRLKMCKGARGVNPVTGVATRESLFC